MSKPEMTELEKKIAIAEEELMGKKQQLAKMRGQLPKMEITNYQLTTPDGKQVKISSMFGDKKDLILIHNMGKGCRYCTLWADGFTGFLPHFQNRAAFVVTTPDKPEVVKKFSESRNWNFPIYSAHGTTLFKDMGFESDKGDPWPGVSTFQKSDDGKLYRISKASFGPGDDFCAIWHFFDLLADGPNGWEPQYDYK